MTQTVYTLLQYLMSTDKSKFIIEILIEMEKSEDNDTGR